MPKRTDLAVGPAPLYAAKAALTRARTLAWLARGAPVREGLRILFYHRVSNDRDELAVAPKRFAADMQWLARQGFRAADVQSALADPTGVVGLSFDDAYRDIAENAMPVLEHHGFTATVFVATGVVDGRARFTWYEQQPPVLGWGEIVSLDGGTFWFEPHTVTHPDLRALNDDAAREEITGSKRELEQRLGRTAEIFCYPAGLYGERERALVRAAGFRYATSCEPGANTDETDPYALCRIQVDARDGLVDFRAKVSGAHDRPPAARALWRRLRHGR